MSGTEQRTILVIGATGQQGGAVARHLLAEGRWRVRALVRDLDTPAAGALRRAGADVVRADLQDRASLRQAMAGAYGVFSVQTFAGPDGIEGEIRQSRAVADAAAEADVGHFVYSSIDGAERDSRVPHFDSKRRGEEYVASLGLRATILRMVFFMDNFSTFSRPPLVDGTLVVGMPVTPGTNLQMLAVEDIGAFATLVFDQPEQFMDRRIALAGDELPMTEIAHTFTTVTGLPARYEQQDIEQVRAYNEDLALMYEFFENQGFQADLASVRQLYPFQTLEDWLRRTRWQPAPEPASRTRLT